MEWIKITDKLPGKGKDVLVVVEKEKIHSQPTEKKSCWAQNI